MRILDFSDGFTSASQPTVGTIQSSGLQPFATDAAFVTAKGSAAANGDAYVNTTINTIRFYSNSTWQSVEWEVPIYASEAAFVTAKGASAADQDFFFDSTVGALKVYSSGWKVMVAETATQTLTNKTLTGPVIDAVVGSHQTTPANPSSGFVKVYAKNDNKLYVLDSSGNERVLLRSIDAVTSFAKSGSTALVGAVTISQGTGMTLTQTGQDVAIANAGVTGFSKNGSTVLTGAVTISQGANITLTQTGQDIAIAAAGGTPTWSASTKTANYTLVASDAIAADASAGGFTLTFPDATTNAGKPIIIVRADSNIGAAVTVAAAGADTLFDGTTSAEIHGQGTATIWISIGTVWYNLS